MSAVPARSKAVIMSRMDEYRARTPRSAALFERASRSLPGGSTRTTGFSPPYAPYIASGEGIRMRDVDGNVYRDFLGNYTSLILGHAHPAVVAAVEEQVRLGSAFAAPPVAGRAGWAAGKGGWRPSSWSRCRAPAASARPSPTSWPSCARTATAS